MFEDLWKAGGRPSIAAFLTDDENRADLLFELVHLDLSSRLKKGEDACVEQYLEQFPELIQDRTGVIELIVAEFRLRGQNGMHPKPESFAARFPSYADELALLLKQPPPFPSASASASVPDSVELSSLPQCNRSRRW